MKCSIELSSKQITNIHQLDHAIESFIDFVENLSSEIPTNDLEEYADTLSYIVDHLDKDEKDVDRS